jgi:GDP-4-dehydro-6-deoxy-D-mannose reductase
MNKAYVTGAHGFVGKHLVKHLQSKHDNVIKNKVDIRDYESLRNALDRQRPTHIYHLAAQAFVPESFTSPARAFEVNTIGSLNILEAVRQLGLQTHILLIGTSEEYGDGGVSEDSYLRPASPYAIAKAAMDYTGQLYAKSYGMHVVVSRAFNHTGPGRGEQYAESSWAKQIVAIERGTQDHLEHGNLASVRNYTDVRDMVRAYSQVIDLPPDVYNICTDQNVTMQEVLDLLSKNSPANVKTKINSALYRPFDFSFKEPNCDKFRSLADWQPEYDLEATLQDLLDYWRAK